MRSALGLALLLALAGCPDAPTTGCQTAESCPPGAICFEGRCQSAVLPDASVKAIDAAVAGEDASVAPDASAAPDAAICAARETRCSDGVDDDCDGLTDCADPDCRGRPCAIPCVVGASCGSNGECTGGVALVCDAPPGECWFTAGACSPETGGCGYSARPPGARCADDGNPCTLDLCDGAGNCLHLKNSEGLACGVGAVCADGSCLPGCSIGGAFVAANAINPAELCQRCLPVLDAVAWSPLPDGTSCSGTNTCVAGSCMPPGACSIGNASYPNGSPATTMPCWRCDVSVSASQWSPGPSGAPCPDDGNSCTSDACDEHGGCVHEPPQEGTPCGADRYCRASDGSCRHGCLIDGRVLDSGAGNPNNPCETCVSGLSWSRLADGAACGPASLGDWCWRGACVTSSCFLDGRVVADQEVNPASGGCQRCDFGRAATQWTLAPAGTPCGSGTGDCGGEACDLTGHCVQANLADGTQCGSGLVCRGGLCTVNLACIIGGVAYSPAQKNPANACQLCLPGRTAGAWSTLDDGESCGAGSLCLAGSCTRGCWIGGAFLGEGVINPANDCQACAPTASASGWTSRPVSSPCATDSNACTSDLCNGTGSCVRASLADGSGCGAGLVCSGGSCRAGCVIGGAFFSPGGANPAQACQVCVAGSSSWATLPESTLASAFTLCCGGAPVDLRDPCNCGSCGNRCNPGTACNGRGCVADSSGVYCTH